MTEQKEKPVKRGLDSKAAKTFLTLAAAFLTFAGPTYVVYTFTRVLKLDFAVATVAGIVLFVIGLALLWLLIKRKAITE